MAKYNIIDMERTDRIGRLIDALFDHMPEIEADRAVLLTESYRATEGEPIITRRAKAFAHICENLPIKFPAGSVSIRNSRPLCDCANTDTLPERIKYMSMTSCSSAGIKIVPFSTRIVGSSSA